MNNIICPVPQDQRPLNEFNSIRNSWINSWPLQEKKVFYRKLFNEDNVHPGSYTMLLNSHDET